MRKWLVFAAGAVLILGQTTSAAAQPRWARGAVPRTGACFYDDANFNGRYFCVQAGQRLASLPRGMGDRISSIRVMGDVDVTVFRDSGFDGRSTRFGRSVRNLKRQGWNDTISSIGVDARGGFLGRVFRGGGGPVWGRGPIPREGACFYEDSNFRGEYFCVNRGEALRSLPPGFNDRISAVRVFHGRVEIFQDDDFRGRSVRIDRNAARLGSSWGDKVSSLRVF